MVDASTLEVHTVAVSDKTVWIFVRLLGSDGVEGVGEATLNARTKDVIAAIPDAAAQASACAFGIAAKLAAARAAAPGVVGRVVASALEQAWLDREARRFGRPLYALLGGHFRDSVPCYANINRGTLTRSPEEFGERAARAVAEGYAAVKLAPFDGVTPVVDDENARDALIEAGMARVAAVVAAVGGRARVNVDCHSRFRAGEAGAILARLAEIGIAWFEEPIKETPDALGAIANLRSVADRLGVTLAGAENAADLAALMPFCVAGCYDVLMPDIVLGGGPAEIVRIGHFVSASGSAISLHNPCGPVMDMHSAHVAVAVPKLHSLERQFRESTLYDSLVTRSARFENGNICLGVTPGLGLVVDWTDGALECVGRMSISI